MAWHLSLRLHESTVKPSGHWEERYGQRPAWKGLRREHAWRTWELQGGQRIWDGKRWGGKAVDEIREMARGLTVPNLVGQGKTFWVFYHNIPEEKWWWLYLGVSDEGGGKWSDSRHALRRTARSLPEQPDTMILRRDTEKGASFGWQES